MWKFRAPTQADWTIQHFALLSLLLHPGFGLLTFTLVFIFKIRASLKRVYQIKGTPPALWLVLGKRHLINTSSAHSLQPVGNSNETKSDVVYSCILMLARTYYSNSRKEADWR